MLRVELSLRQIVCPNTVTLLGGSIKKSILRKIIYSEHYIQENIHLEERGWLSKESN